MYFLSQFELNRVKILLKTKQLYFNMHYLVKVNNGLIPKSFLARQHELNLYVLRYGTGSRAKYTVCAFWFRSGYSGLGL